MAREIGRKSPSSWTCWGTSLSYSEKSAAVSPLTKLPEWSVTEVGATTRRTGTRRIGSWADKSAGSNSSALSHGKQDTERGSSELAGHQENVATCQQRALTRNRQDQAHTAALERNGRLKQRASRLRAEPGTRVMHFNSNLVGDGRRHAQHQTTGSDGLRGIFEQIREYAFDQIFVGIDAGMVGRQAR